MVVWAKRAALLVVQWRVRVLVMQMPVIEQLRRLLGQDFL
jgi:hypothetical protein